jgi:prefoldin subunit 5
MKIHLDYLEGRVEELENTNLKLTSDKKSLSKRIREIEDKMRSASEEADKVERRHKEALEKLEREVREAKITA